MYVAYISPFFRGARIYTGTRPSIFPTKGEAMEHAARWRHRFHYNIKAHHLPIKVVTLTEYRTRTDR